MLAAALAEGGGEKMFQALVRVHGPEPAPGAAPSALEKARLPDVAALAAAHAGREADLLAALAGKYAVPEKQPRAAQAAPRPRAAPGLAAAGALHRPLRNIILC
ncbi:hypothetical protein DIPPA_30024 [Diplonema papillatum]|nr:hypothetical protein DIPPA_30024 [Diplonema papillatum]